MAFIGATNWNQLYNQGSTGNTTGSTGTGFIGGGLAGVGSVLGGQSGNTTSGLAGVGSVLGGVTGANPTSSGSSGLLGGAANIVTGGTSGVLPGAPTGTGFIGGLGTTVLGGGYGSIPRPGRPVRPVRPGRPGRPFIGGINTIRPSRQTVPYHTHTMEHNGWTKETGGPTNMRREKIVYNTPRPPFFGGYGRPTLPQGPPIQPRPVTTIKPGMNIPAVPQAPIMRNASGCGAGYSNASGGDNCSLWMCATGH